MKTFSSKLLFYVKKSILKSAPKERQFISRFLSSLFPYFLSSLDPQFLSSSVPQFLQYCFNNFINRDSFCFSAVVSDETMA